MTAHALATPRRRGACPGLSAPMPTGDGLLVRLVPIGIMSLAAFAALCAAARTHGNGVIEVTSRGSIQLRGLSASSAPPCAAAIADLRIAAEDGIPIHCNPLSGIDADEIFNAGALAAQLRHALAERSMASGLSPKVSIAIDGGGQLDLRTLAADIRLSARAVDGRVSLRVSAGGDEASAADLGVIAPAEAIQTVVRLLEVLTARGRTARARDVFAASGTDVDGTDKPGHDSIGMHLLRDGSYACGIGLAFGHAVASALERLAEVAATAGASGLRAAPGRTLLAIGLTPQTAAEFVAAAAQLGFIVLADDPRRYVIACAGAPICASAHIAARALAPRIADQAAARLGDALTIHISGCAKGCAQATAAALTVVGTAGGCALIARGTTRDQPFATVPADELPAAIAKYAREQSLEVENV
ncbi:MAG: precorrin-3B synthase [Xanthobacteraceae bacterium]|jgi:precorrin-3B synthase